MDVFTGQMTTAVLGSYKENNVLFVNVPANMTNYYQPLNLTVNSYAKWHMKNKFNSWYSKRVKQQLDNAVNLKDVNFKLQLTITQKEQRWDHAKGAAFGYMQAGLILAYYCII